MAIKRYIIIFLFFAIALPLILPFNPGQAQGSVTPTAFLYLPYIIELRPTPIPSDVVVLDNHSTWSERPDGRSRTYLYGEIFNNTPNRVKPLGVEVNFYDDQGRKLETINSTYFNNFFNVLPPGQRSCFYIVRGFHLADPEFWAYYDFAPVQFIETTKAIPKMSLTDMYTSTIYTGLTAHLTVNVDGGAIEADTWIGKATTYDDQRKVILCQNIIDYTLKTVPAGTTIEGMAGYTSRRFPNQNINPFDPAQFRLELPGGRGVAW